MADISKIKTIDGTEYNVKDAKARTAFVGATDSIAGTGGAVPAPTTSDYAKYLCGDGTWADAPRYGNTRVFYGTSDTAATTRQKDVSITGVTELITGDVFVITFTYAQTYNGGPRLKINDIAYKAIRRLTGTNAARYEWNDGETVIFLYNGSYFLIMNGGFATTTYYGRTKLVTSATSTSTATALTPASLNTYSQSMVSGAPVYDASATYAVGDRVRYSYNTWECTTAITEAEAWNAEHWDALPSIQEQIAPITNAQIDALFS